MNLGGERDSGKHRASQVTSRVQKVETKEQGRSRGGGMGSSRGITSGRRHTVGCSWMEVSGWIGRSTAWPRGEKGCGEIPEVFWIAEERN